MKNIWLKIMKIFKKEVSLNTFTAILALYYTIVLNAPFFLAVNKGLLALNEINYLFVLSMPFLLFSLLAFLFSFISLKYIIKPIFILLLLSSAMVFYAALHYGTIFDNAMIENTMQTNRGEALAYFNSSFLMTFFIVGVLPAYWVLRVKISYRGWAKESIYKALFMAATLASAVLIALPLYETYASFGRNNSYLNKVIIPTQYVWSLKNYVVKKYILPPQPFKKIGEDAVINVPKEKKKPNLLVIVLGETARAESFAYQGYGKPTNAHTQPYNVIYFKDVSSCGTATAQSVPCMFSNLTREGFSERVATNQSSALDVLQYAGHDVEWIDNDDGCKDICDRVKNIEIPVNSPSPWCDGEYCKDGIVLEYFDKALATKKEQDRVIGLHVIGSHGPTYYRRYPDEHRFFKPDCARSDIQNCSQDALLNTYDNTILYTDYILAQLIKRLQSLNAQYNTALLYVSDHGESLGEKGMYLHATPYAFAPSQQTHIPLLLWLSPSFSQENKINEACLRKNAASKKYSHDNVFHSLLGLGNVDTKIYNADLDVLSGCRKK